MRRSYVVGLACAVLVSVAVAGLAVRAGAEDEKGGPPPGGMPPPQKKVDHPLLKALVGSWSIVQKSPMGDSTGTAKFAIALGGTALLEDYDLVGGSMGAYGGHGVFKPSDDGRTLNLWWFHTHGPEPMVFTGPLTDKGYDLKTADGTRVVLAQTGTGFEFKLSMGDGPPMFTDTYTKK